MFTRGRVGPSDIFRGIHKRVTAFALDDIDMMNFRCCCCCCRRRLLSVGGGDDAEAMAEAGERTASAASEITASDGEATRF